MRIMIVLIVLNVISLCALAEDRRLVGNISDSVCAEAHNSRAQHQGQILSDQDCTLACVKKGAKYVFVSQGKIYHVSNQTFAGIEQLAGRTVILTGDFVGDDVKILGFRISPSNGH